MWKVAVLAEAIATGFSTAVSAWDPGFSQPGAIGNVAVWR
jgi:hypothetical protein